MKPILKLSGSTAVGVCLGICFFVVSVAGCQSESAASKYTVNPALRPIAFPSGGTPSDADRATLARFVGVWNFEGGTQAPDGTRINAKGIVAGVIEDEHFVLLDIEVTEGQLAGRAGRKAGSMFLAAEPGIGMTLTAWGDASPSISRLIGEVHGNGSVFTFREARTPPGRRRIGLEIQFESDDRWVAEVMESTAQNARVVARYAFTRAR